MPNTQPEKVLIAPTEEGGGEAAREATAPIPTDPVDASVEAASKRINWLSGIIGAAVAIFIFGVSSMKVAAKLMTKEDFEAQMQRRDTRIAAEIKPIKDDVNALKEDRAVLKTDVDWLKKSNVRLEEKLDQLLEIGGVARTIRGRPR